MSVPEHLAERMRQVLRRDVDWSQVLAWAKRHGLSALLFRTLSALDSRDVPAQILETLRARRDAIRFKNLVLAREVVRIVAILEAAGIPATPYKGPALSALLFNDTGLREFGDIDLLVRPQDALKARHTLLDHGFISRDGVSRRFEALRARFHCSFKFDALDGNVLLELNWRTVPSYWRLPEIPESAWRTIGRLPLAGGSVPWFSPDNVLLVLCLHGCKHKWEWLKWVVDVAELIAAHHKLDWRGLLDYVRETGAERMLALGLYLAQDLLDAALPPIAFEVIERNPLITSLAEDVYATVFAMPAVAVSTLDELPFLSRASQQYATKLHCRMLMPPYFLLHRVLRPGQAAIRRMAEN
jgi:hypothetical protein